MKNFRFLAIAILMLSALILPVNASYLIDGSNPSSSYTWANDPTDTVCIIAYYDRAIQTGSGMVYQTNGDKTFRAVADYNTNAYNQESIIAKGNYIGRPPAAVFYLNPYQRGYNTYTIYVNNQSLTSVSYTITDDYHTGFGNVYIDKVKTGQTSDSISYDVQCMPAGNMRYTEIGFEPLTLTSSTPLTSEQTLKTIVIGNHSTTVYAIAYNGDTGQKTMIQETLTGLDDIPTPTPTPTIEPTIEPTAQPTGAPSGDLSQYGEKKNFQIRNIDYLQGTQLNGVNLTVYYTDIADNIISNPVYKNTNSPAVIDLQVPKAGGLFVEYGYMPNYEPVKLQTYPYLNNKVGYWINQEISDYETLYYVFYDNESPLVDINYGITLIDGNTHLPVSNAAINIDGANTQYTTNYGGTVFRNITQGLHTFTISKQGYNTLTFTKNIAFSASTELEFFPISAIPTATITPSPVKPITPSPTISPIDKPTSILESVSYGLAKIFGVKTVENANYIFALMLILFPAVVAGGITHQALAFVAGGMIGFVFALAVGLIPIWVFFAMCLLAVIFFVLKGGNEGF